MEFLEIITGKMEWEMLTIEESVLKENIFPEVLPQDPLALVARFYYFCIRSYLDVRSSSKSNYI